MRVAFRGTGAARELASVAMRRLVHMRAGLPAPEPGGFARHQGRYSEDFRFGGYAGDGTAAGTVIAGHGIASVPHPAPSIGVAESLALR